MIHATEEMEPIQINVNIVEDDIKVKISRMKDIKIEIDIKGIKTR